MKGQQGTNPSKFLESDARVKSAAQNIRDGKHGNMLISNNYFVNPIWQHRILNNYLVQESIVFKFCSSLELFTDKNKIPKAVELFTLTTINTWWSILNILILSLWCSLSVRCSIFYKFAKYYKLIKFFPFFAALTTSFKQNPLTSDNLMKIQEDR